MPMVHGILVATLVPGVAAVTLRIRDKPVAVINSAAAHDASLRTQAAWSLACLGLDAGNILGALHGVRR